MKLKLILSAALIAGVISANATAPVTPVTNSTSEAMKALFGDPVVVKAKGFEIKRSEVDELMSSLKIRAAGEGQTVPPEYEAVVLNELVANQLLLQKATAADRASGKAVSDSLFDRELKKYPTPEAFAQQLKAANVTESEMRAKTAQAATARAAIIRELGIAITDEQAKQFYTENPAKFELAEKAHVRHILLMTIDPSTRPPTPLSTNAVAAKRKQAEDLLKRVNAGEDFAKLATQYSEDPGSKNTGGELPEFVRGQMVPEFEAAAFALAPDKVSDIITTQFGYHIIKSLSKTAARKVPYTEVAADLKDGLASQQLAKAAPDYLTKLRKEFDVQIVDERLKALDEKVRAASAAAAAEATALPATK
jgi:parvulin-like peptidyl-prolyl isomerase